MRRLVPWLVAAVVLSLPSGAVASTFDVNTFLDTQSDGVCDADCTVRDAVTTADGSDTILLPPGTHTVSLAGAPEDANASGDIDANGADDPLTIKGTGPDPSAVTIDATGLGDRVFDLSTGAEFLIANLTITGGSGVDGGGIRNAGPELTLSEVVLDGNTAPSTGGAILNGTTATAGSRVTILDSVLTDNRALAGDGGAIRNQDDGRLAIIRSSLNGNSAEGGGGDGGAIFNEDQASLTVATSRIEQNEAFADDFVGGGGGIYTQNSSTTTVSDSLIVGNESDNGGGGIYANNDTSLTVIDSVVSGNTALAPAAERGGGGINAGNDSAVTILRSTLSGNSAAFGGGGVMRQNDGVLEIVNSTLSGNTTPASGGAVHADSASFGRTRIDHSTIAQNSAAIAGGGIFNSTESTLFEPLVFAGTIISGNLVAGAPQNCAAELAGAASVVSRGFNLDSGSTCGLTATGDLQNANALLGPLADNGGPTLTHLPGAGGAATDAGVSGGHETDQRGDARTVDQPAKPNAPGSDGTDIGAVELALQPTPTPIVVPEPAVVPKPGFDLKAAIAKCKKKFPKGKQRKKCIKRARARA